jgi:glycosyltransferase involved in cell wall biosynthesis/MoaA/NifB/PqqE/SkfB family radical SAM enzyme
MKNNPVNKQPLLSICCITYNHEKYIEKAIEAFLIQKTNFPIEIIIHDDASTDNTAEIIKKYANQDSRIVPILRKENIKSTGVPVFPIIYQKAKGKYIAVCEGDDFWTDPHKLQKQVDFLEANPEYVISYHNAKIIDEENNVVTKSKLKDKLKRDFSSDELIKGKMLLTLTMCFRNVLTDFPVELNKVKNGDKFLTSLLGNYGKGKYQDEIEDAVYRQHDNSIWSSLDKATQVFHNGNTRAWLSRYYKRIGENEYAGFFKKESFQFLKRAVLLEKESKVKNSAIYKSIEENYCDLFDNSLISQIIINTSTIAEKSSIKKNNTIEIAEQLITDNKLSEANKILLELAIVDPTNLEVKNNLAVISVMEENIEEVLKYIYEVLEIHIENDIAIENYIYVEQNFDLSSFSENKYLIKIRELLGISIENEKSKIFSSLKKNDQNIFIDKKSMISVGDPTLFDSDTLHVDWVVTRKCNYGCSYCTVHNNKTGFFVDLASMKQAVDGLNKLESSKVQILLAGGEPTIYPQFFEFVEYLFEKLGDRLFLRVQTNLGKPLSFFKKFAEKLYLYNDKIEILSSYHFEFAEPEKYFKKIKILVDNKFNVKINLLAHPEHIEEVKKLNEYIKTITNKNLRLNLVTVRHNYGQIPDKRYTEDDIKWLKSNYSNTEKKNIEIKYWDETKEIIESTAFLPDEITIKQMNNFKGFECAAGKNMISINADGSLDPSICLRKLKGNKPNIFNNPNAFEEISGPVECPFDNCGIPACVVLPKYSKQLNTKNSAEDIPQLGCNITNYMEVVPTLELAEQLIAENKLDDAESTLLLLKQKDSSSLEVTNDLAVIEIMKENLLNALLYIDEVLEQDPNNEIAKENFVYLEQNFESDKLASIEKYDIIKSRFVPDVHEEISGLEENQVVKVGSTNYLNNKDTVNINWVVTRKCNYTCSYCRVYNNNDKFKPLSYFKNAVGQITNLKKNKYKITLTGGEPTIFPEFVAFLKYLFEKLGKNLKLTIISNLGRTPRFFNELAEQLNGYEEQISFVASYHFEFADKNIFLENVRILTENRFFVKVQIMAHPEKMELVKELEKELSLIKSEKLHYQIMVIRENYGSVPDKRYKDEDVEWLKKYYDNQEEQKDILIVRETEEGEIAENYYSAPEINTTGLNKFHGLVCEAGLNNFSINENGLVDKSVCFRGQDANSKNIYRDNNALSDINQPIICPFERCGCTSDIQIPKYSIEYYKNNIIQSEMPLEIYLAEKKWAEKLSIYQRVFDYAKILKPIEKPAISVIVISWRLHPDTIKNFQILEKQKNTNFELIFVDNGGKVSEFDSLKPYVHTYIKLNTNTGAYLARNVGAVFAQSPILLFLEDDGIPSNNLVENHLEIYDEYNIIGCRGKYIPKTDIEANRIQKHYDLGETPIPYYLNLEGNCSIIAREFFQVGGWDDNIMYGYGGADLTFRLQKKYPDKNPTWYFPSISIFHDYSNNINALNRKIENQETSRINLEEKNAGFTKFLLDYQNYHLEQINSIELQTAAQELLKKYKKNIKEFSLLLEKRNWVNKKELYLEYLDRYEEFKKNVSPSISIIVISWRLHLDNLKSFQILKNQRDQNFELIFVNNGADEKEFEPLKPYIDKYIRLNTNTGAYLARNIGSLFAEAPILLFLEDDGIPESNLIKAHLDLFDEYEIIACRGVYIPKTNNPLNKKQGHYYISDKEYPTFAHVEGNTTYLAETFFKAGGWDDEIRFGGGGQELYFRLLNVDPDKRKQIYSPRPIIYHDYASDDDHLKNKLEKQRLSFERLRTKYPEWDDVTRNFKLNCDRDDMLIRKKKSIEHIYELVPQKISKILFVNHNLYPLEISGTPISTLNHVLGIKNKGVEVAVLIPSSEIKNDYSKEVLNDYTLYKVPELDKFNSYLGDIEKTELNRYTYSIEKIIYDFNPEIVHINDYVRMPAKIISLFSKSGAHIIRNVCNPEELCHLDSPVYFNGKKDVLCSGPESAEKCSACYIKNVSNIKIENTDDKEKDELTGKFQTHFDEIKSHYDNNVDGVIFTSEPFEKYFSKFINLSKNLVKINPRGFKFDIPRTTEIKKVNTETIHVGFFGSLISRKGIDTLLKSFKQIISHENFVLDIYSSDYDMMYLDQIRDLENNYPEKIKFYGKYEISELSKITETIDFAVVPSVFDTFNRVVRELMYFGIPLIVTDFFGASIIKNNINGIKIKIGDYKELADSIKRLLSDPSLIVELSKGVVNTKINSMEDEINGIYNFYNEVKSRQGSKFIFKSRFEKVVQAEEFLEQQDIKSAKNLLLDVLSIDKNNLDAHNDLSVVYIMEEEYSMACDHIDNILNQDPSNEIALGNLQYIEERLGEIQKNNALSDPQWENELLFKAEALIEEDQYEDAQEILEMILHKKPANIDALNDLVVVYILKQEFQNALSTINSLLKIDPRNEVALENLKYLDSIISRNLNQVNISENTLNKLELK